MVKEIILMRQINKYLEKKGFEYKNEVDFLERRIDVVGKRENDVISIEAKVKDWKKALAQALTCKLCSHYTYAAFWYKFIPKNLTVFKKHGIGVMAVKESVEIICKAKRSKIIHNSLLKRVSEIKGKKNDRYFL